MSATPTARDLRPLVGEWRRDDLGANPPCPWREGGKAAGDPGGRRSCWLLCVVFVCVFFEFSYDTHFVE